MQAIHDEQRSITFAAIARNGPVAYPLSWATMRSELGSYPTLCSRLLVGCWTDPTSLQFSSWTLTGHECLFLTYQSNKTQVTSDIHWIHCIIAIIYQPSAAFKLDYSQNFQATFIKSFFKLHWSFPPSIVKLDSDNQEHIHVSCALCCIILAFAPCLWGGWECLCQSFDITLSLLGAAKLLKKRHHCLLSMC